MNKQIIFTGTFSLLMISCVQAAWRSPAVFLAKVPKTSQANVANFLRYRKGLSEKFLGLGNDNFEESLRESHSLGTAMNRVDHVLRKQGIEFDATKDSPDDFVKALEPKKVEALDKHLRGGDRHLRGSTQLENSAD
ncbi:MAG: hypothetical protein WD055_01950 [Candidatus Dependentiae bacterium]